MSIPKQDHQSTFYDASFLTLDLFKPTDRYEIFRQHVLPALQASRENLCRLYCSDNGRAAIEPVTMAGVTLLQFMEKAPDRTAADNVRLHLGWKPPRRNCLSPSPKPHGERYRPLRGKKDIALRVGKVINRYKMAKHFKLTITHANFKYERKEEKIKAEAALDGFYVVRTSVSAQSLTPEATVSTYKRLSVVERAFRCLKTVDMKVRPIFHRLAKRVRAHILLCTLAYYVEWEMRRLLAPILFDDEDHELAEQQRSSVVAPVQRSQTARRKASSKHTADGVPVHSFRTLLKDLATITKNQIQPNLPDAPTFEKVTQPTRTQKKTLDLLGIKL